MTDRRIIDDGECVLASPVSVDASTLPVADTQWTVNAADYPLRLIVGGELVEASGILTAGTQTFTGVTRALNGVVKAHAAGTSVAVADPFRGTMSHATAPATPLTGVPPDTPPPAELPDIPLDDLVLWIDAGFDPAAGNLVAEPYEGELGSTAGADAQDPVVAVAGAVDVWDPDGSDDHIDTDYTPTFTPTAGAATFVFIGVYDEADAAEPFQRALSSESASSNGININFDDTGIGGLSASVGGATTLGFRFWRPVDGLTLVDGQRFMVAAVVDTGALRLYETSLGLSAPVSITGVGTITHAPVRFFRPSADAVASRAATTPMQAGLVYERALSQSELDEIAAAYGVTGGPGTPGQFRTQQALATPGSPPHVLTALGYTDTALITRAQLDDILDDWVASTGGTTRNVTSTATWATAMAAAVPGDLIRITSPFTIASGQLSARGNLYGLSGSTMTTSPAGGTEAEPIIVTCADGVAVTGSGLTNNVPVLDLVNTRHVWSIGFNAAGTSQFGIRAMNWGGTAAAPAYRAYNTMNGVRDAGCAAQGWFQLITSSGGTPPAGSGNEWGFSEHFVDEMSTVFDPNPGEVAGNPGEGYYYGRGASPGWVSYAKDFWCRGNLTESYVANGFEAKPGCRRGRIVDNIAYLGRGQNGAPFELCYQFSGLDDRPAYMNDIDGSGNGDIQIWCEANRVYDYNLTETGATRNQLFLLGMAGVRIANNQAWSARDSAGNAGAGDNLYAVLIQSEKDVADFGNTATQPTWVVNNNWQARKVTNLGAVDGAITGITTRNNITPAGYGGEHTAGSSDYVGPVPASVGALSTADAGLGPGSGFELVPASALVGAGSSISDLALAIDADIIDRPIPATSPSPGPYQSP